MEKNISLSILKLKNEEIPVFLKQYKKVIKKIEESKINVPKFNNIVHFDVMDAKFVPNIGVDLKYIKTAKNLGFYIDTHLMVANPIGDKYVEKAIEYGTDDVTIHYEIENFESVLNYLNERKAILKKDFNRDLIIGVSIKPNTELSIVEKYKDKFSKLLIMSVEPGLGGQKYIQSSTEKIIQAKKMFKNHIIQVDGGINFNTIKDVINVGVDSIVMGSYLTDEYNTSLYDKLLELNILKAIEELPKKRNIDFDLKLLQIVKNGYGEGDLLVGIAVPDIRNLANKWYKYIDYCILNKFISSKYHEYRQFACICMSYMMKKNLTLNNEALKKEKSINLLSFFESKLDYINNWDLTDEISPNVLGNYLLLLSDKEAKVFLKKYIESSNFWVRRIGVVSCLAFARKGYKDIPLYVCSKLLYDEELLINKAVGWVLREVYKKHPKEIIDFLKENNKSKKIPRFVMSYATEKMTKEEKDIVKK